MIPSLANFARIAAVAAVVSADRTITVNNKCSYTVWPGLSTDSGQTSPSQPTGWEMASGASVSFSVPDNWTGGHIWPRTDCDFSTSNASTSCSTGGCDGGLECTSSSLPVAPVTVADFYLATSGGTDVYDVSVINGFNVPVGLIPSAACADVGCPANLNANCPTKLQRIDASGKVVGCFSDCNVDPNPSNSPSCCTGSFSTLSTCPRSGIPDYAFFKNNCPDSLVYTYDETSSPLPCPASEDAQFVVTFCP